MLDESTLNKVVMNADFAEVTDVSLDDVYEAMNTYMAVILEVYRAVHRDVFGEPREPEHKWTPWRRPSLQPEKFGDKSS